MKIFIRFCCVTFLFCAFLSSKAQEDVTASKIFKALSDSNTFKLDTSTAPADILTRKIKQLRSIRGNFNPNELIKFKIKEEQSKSKEFPPEFYKRLLTEFETGTANVKLENTIINLYRKYFTLKILIS